MATRTIQSPGVEIREVDLSLRVPQNIGTNFYLTGFAQQGPLDEVIKVSTKSEAIQIFGAPTNPAERYFMHTMFELLNSPGNVYVNRLPYGAGTGDGFGSMYSALVYPVQAVQSGYVYGNTNGDTKYFNLSAATFSIKLNGGNTYTFGFSSISYAPLLSSLDAYVLYTNGTVTNAALFDGLSAAINTLEPNATFTKTSNELYIGIASCSGSVIDTQLPTGHTLTVPNSGMVTSTLDLATAVYVLGQPTHFELTESEYLDILEGTAYNWLSTGATTFKKFTDWGSAGLVVLNKAQTTINGQYEGYYVGLLDNSNINPASNFDGILYAQTVSQDLTCTDDYLTIPNGTLDFHLSSEYASGPTNSVSEIMEKLTNYDIDGRDDDDVLNVGVFKLRKSVYATQAFKLDAVLEDAIVGSIDSHRTQLNPLGGLPKAFFLEATDNNSRNVEILVNPYISNKFRDSSLDVTGIPRKKVRVLTRQLRANTNSNITGLTTNALDQMRLNGLNYADSLYSLGAYADAKMDEKIIGNLPDKIERALDAVRCEELYDIDVVVEGGLTTIYVATSSNNKLYFDDIAYDDTLEIAISALRTSRTLDAKGEKVRGDCSVIFNKFEQFCSPPHIGGGRGDCIYVADPLRYIFVVGKNSKVLADRAKNFQQHIYWALKHQFEFENTSYAATYANWLQVYDEYSGEKVWIPSSGYAAACMARSDAASFPWFAPAGLNRGLLSYTAVDLAVIPNQKQRDELYKSNFNPISFFPSQGMVIFGQKTLLRKPSAFDRINVRRLFLALERPTKKAAQYFVFEPNTAFTRTRVINTLTPLFEKAKNNEGLYDYIIVCDERNNTPEVIDNNELVIDIYLKAVRAAEFVLVNFIATRTDANFQEIINA